MDGLENKGNRIPITGGDSLRWGDNKATGRTYRLDEIGGRVPVWDTGSVNQSTLLTAIRHENILVAGEREIGRFQVRLSQSVTPDGRGAPYFSGRSYRDLIMSGESDTVSAWLHRAESGEPV